ncbi:MAG: CoA activase [Deltaproteobacteria bacterium]|nr:CoA activase [Deltaproteobacteria bacterium]
MPLNKRFLGIDIGAENIKIAELTLKEDGKLEFSKRELVEHNKEPEQILLKLLKKFKWESIDGATVTGRMSRSVNLQHIPVKQAQIHGFNYLFGKKSATIVSIGSHGFSVLEMRDSNVDMFRENSRCSQGTGNFLRQLVERFNLTIEEASQLSAPVNKPAPLSGRCPVILKTDMTHLANKGEPQERILAGLFDAVCENVQVLIKPRLSPRDVVLIGGVTQSPRIKATFKKFLDKNEMSVIETKKDDNLYFEALGAASIAAEDPKAVPPLDKLFKQREAHTLERLPGLSDFLKNIKRLPKEKLHEAAADEAIVLGFDIGSTGSKVVAVSTKSKKQIWESYINTNGAPVIAAQNLMINFTNSYLAKNPVVAVGATGSGREIVGSLMTTCYGGEKVFVLNEIAAHAEGATYFDKRVDTIFEIGGQDAKYIRLQGGRVIDAAMNEACSAGTGSFIEEQGNKFSGIKNVIQLAEEALKAPEGVSLGQHCSVFMAEIIDEAVASNVPRHAIVAGIYDSIIQNYLNRVKGSRSVGKIIFCQGMPFASDALAAAVARQTGAKVIIPPNPGTIGALGIALLSIKELDLTKVDNLDLNRFLNAEIIKKDVFTCKSTKGCGGSGNYCRIDRITTIVEGVEQKFTWGGGCSLYDKGTGKKKLPDLAPNPFKEREDMVDEIIASLPVIEGAKTVAVTDQFMLKSMFPFFASYISYLGFNIVPFKKADHATLKRGIEDGNVPFCAPMQQFHGVVGDMNDAACDYMFLPMIRGGQRIKEEPWARLCPIVQAAPDMLIQDLGTPKSKIISPVINIGKGNFESRVLKESCKSMAELLGVNGEDFEAPYLKAAEVQNRFDAECIEIGKHALEFCENTGVTPVVVLGRPYTIHNDVLNSNVPNILREQGAIAIPVDCFPTAEETPIFPRNYWGYGQRILRAAHQIRRTKGVYSLLASNYSCGPDSFNEHFYTYIMDGKPCAIIETDGHSGDAGTKTRIEAFLYCVHEDLNTNASQEFTPTDFMKIQTETEELDDIKKRDATVLLPRMGPGAGTLSAALRGIGIKAQALDMPDAEALSLGRRQTSGKECFPMVITMGSLLKHLKHEKDKTKNFSFFMPMANGPCRFGAYDTLNEIILERLDLKKRVGIWAPVDDDYFATVPDGFAAVAYGALAAADFLLEGLYTARPVEKKYGEAQGIWDFYTNELETHLEKYTSSSTLSAGNAIANVVSGNLFGITNILKRASRAFKDIMLDKDMPEVLIVGEIYVRCDPFSNDFVIDQLEQRGIRCRFAPFNEWLEYTDYQEGELKNVGDAASKFIQASIQHQLYNAMAKILHWPDRTTVQDSLAAAKPYLRENLSGEAVLTIGGPIHEWRTGHIDGTLAVGPLECMPNKIAQNQFHHIAEKEGLPSLTLHLNGDPVDPEILDNFAYEIHAQHKKKLRGERVAKPPISPRPPIWKAVSKHNPKNLI